MRRGATHSSYDRGDLFVGEGDRRREGHAAIEIGQPRQEGAPFRVRIDLRHDHEGQVAAAEHGETAVRVSPHRQAGLRVVREPRRALRQVNDAQPGRLSFEAARPLVQDLCARDLALEEERKGRVAEPVPEDREVGLRVVVRAREHVVARRADHAVQRARLVHEGDGAGRAVEAVDDNGARPERRLHREQLARRGVESVLEFAAVETGRGGGNNQPRQRGSCTSRRQGQGARHMLGRVFIAGAFLLLAVCHTNPSFAENVTVITGATVIHPSKQGAAAVEPGSTIVISGDRIQLAGPGITLELPQGAKVIDARGKWVIPGLVDGHVHFFQSGNLYTRPDAADFNAVVPYAEEVARNKARLDATFKVWLASGVTGVVDVGGPFWNFDARDRAAASSAAPRMAVAGPLISMIDRPQLDLGDPPIVQITSPEAARALVARELARNPDYIKVWFIHQEGDDLAAQEAIVKAAGDAAHAAGKRLAVHATELAVAKAALRAGADYLVHGVYDRPVDEEFIALAKKNRALLCPTLFVMDGYRLALSNTWKATDVEVARADPEILAAMDDLSTMPPEKIPAGVASLMAKPRPLASTDVAMKDLRRLVDAGVEIVMGTDAGNIGTLHGPSIHREMKLMAEAGLTPLEVLRSATLHGARALGLEGKAGKVEAGMLADLVILDADPLADVANLAKVHRTIKGGMVYEPEALMKGIR